MLKLNKLLVLFLLLLSFTLAGCKGETKENDTKDNSSQVKSDAEGESLKAHGQGKRFYENEPRWVTAQGGLKMRKTFSLNSEVIIVIPEGEMVRINAELPDEEEIAGVKGKWSRVEYLRETGWVFGGFLSENNPTQTLSASKEMLVGAWLGTIYYTAHHTGEGDEEFKHFMILNDNNEYFTYNKEAGEFKGKWSFANNILTITTEAGSSKDEITFFKDNKLELKIGINEYNYEYPTATYKKVSSSEIENLKKRALSDNL